METGCIIDTHTYDIMYQYMYAWIQIQKRFLFLVKTRSGLGQSTCCSLKQNKITCFRFRGFKPF